MSSRYRADIDGLRAVAVVPVLLCHAGVVGFSGGYVGVDVFFVLSGFLVTQLLLRDIVSIGRIRQSRFYSRRFRRLLPYGARSCGNSNQLAAIVTTSSTAIRAGKILRILRS